MRIQHLLQSKEFTEVFENSTRQNGDILGIYVNRGFLHEDTLQIGIVISKKCAPRAVLRNYVKRRIYSYFREKEDFLKGGYRIIIRINKNISDLSRKTISQKVGINLDQLLIKAGVLS